MKVGIVDERSEIAGSRRGIPAFDVGPRTDILDGCPKAEGMMMMIRSLSPDVLIADEIGRPEDAEAVTEALHAGISVVASAHGKEVIELARRPGLGGLLEQRCSKDTSFCIAQKQDSPFVFWMDRNADYFLSHPGID